jgi:hypothetical protein
MAICPAGGNIFGSMSVWVGSENSLVTHAKSLWQHLHLDGDAGCILSFNYIPAFALQLRKITENMSG